MQNNLTKLGISLSGHEINCWLDTDYGEPGYGFLSDEEIIELCKKSSLGPESSSKEVAKNGGKLRITLIIIVNAY